MKSRSRYKLLSVILFLYFVPLLALGIYKANQIPTGNWNFFTYALMLLSTGGICLFWLLSKWENSFSIAPVLELPPEQYEGLSTPSSYSFQPGQIQELEVLLTDQNQQNALLKDELDSKNLKIDELEIDKEHLRSQLDLLEQQQAYLKESSEEKFEQNQIFLHEHQQTIAEQRQALEIKQQHIQQLEDKVRDLTYEIKTLLNLAEKAQLKCQNEIPFKDEPFPLAIADAGEGLNGHGGAIRTEGEAIIQLRRCIDIAQKMTGASHYMTRQSKMPPIDHYALDLRRLFDSLRNENYCAIIVYSQKESKLIFANPQVKSLLEWPSDKFIYQFSSIIAESSDIWEQSLSQLAYKNECIADLSMKARTGSLLKIKCHLGIVPTGLFRSHIIGVLYKA